MRKGKAFALAVLTVIVGGSFGCAYRVYVRGVVPPEPPVRLGQGAAVHVRQQPRSGDRTLNAPIAPKIEKLLEEKGYRPATEADAEFVLLYAYDSEGLIEKRVLEPISGPISGMMTERREGPFVHTLSLSVITVQSYRAGGQPEIVWAGGAALDTTPLHSPGFVDLLLVAAFERFGEDTDGTVRGRMSMGDRRARELRRL